MKLNWNFDNSYLNLPPIFYSFVKPSVHKNPKIAILNSDLLKKINLKNSSINQRELAKNLSAQYNLDKNKFYSQAYAGHQFGHFTMLGDGRALLLGEHIDKDNNRYDIQLKGSGKTPYSRNGDGKASLGSMLREYIISESMYNLGIPTTRSLAVIETGENVIREKELPGAILTRVAGSHIRVGTFQFALMKNNKDYIEELTNYTINRHYPELNNRTNKVEEFLKIVSTKQEDLIVNWMKVGFIHGVMNTDNMSIIGETIDYGPCAFMDEYNPKTVFSSIDKLGRYSYINQPLIAQWNLARFAETIFFLIDNDQAIALKKAENIIKKFKNNYNKKWLVMMKSKIGLINNHKEDSNLIKELLNIMHIHKLDYTNTFQDLKNNSFNKFNFLTEWYEKYKERLRLEKTSADSIKKITDYANPTIIPRNHIVDKYIKEAENKQYESLYNFLEIIKNPYINDNIPKILKKPPNNDEKILETFCGT